MYYSLSIEHLPSTTSVQGGLFCTAINSAVFVHYHPSLALHFDSHNS